LGVGSIGLIAAIITGKIWASKYQETRQAKASKGTVVTTNSGTFIIITIIGFALAALVTIEIIIPLLVLYWYVPAAAAILWLMSKISRGSSQEAPKKPEPAPEPPKSSRSFANTFVWIIIIVALGLAAIAILESIGEVAPSPLPSYDNSRSELQLLGAGLLGLRASALRKSI